MPRMSTLTVNDVTYDIADPAVRDAVHRNLLDNSDFTNPVNQRGKTSYTGPGYSIDRIYIESGSVTVSEDCVSFSSGVYYQTCKASVAKDLADKMLTIAVMENNGNIRVASGTVGQFSPASYGSEFSFGVGFFESSKQLIRIVVNDGYTAAIRWIALYEGEYTAETLPKYQPKGYEHELLICHQYDYSTGNYIGMRKFSQSHNLLVNSDFRNPVNQRGKTSYTENGYTLDRWNMWNDSGSCYVAINDGYISISFENHGTLVQHFEKGFLDLSKTYTLAKKLTDGSIVLSCPAWISSTETLDFITLVDMHNGDVLNVEWAALYEGEYTAETLPEYQPKGYGAELVECLRYYQIYDEKWFTGLLNSSGSCLYTMNLPVQMRTVPTANFSSNSEASFDVFGLGTKTLLYEYFITYKDRVYLVVKGADYGNRYITPSHTLTLSADL